MVEVLRFWTMLAMLSTTPRGAGTLKRSLVLLFGVLSYGVFLFAFLYQIAEQGYKYLKSKQCTLLYLAGWLVGAVLTFDRSCINNFSFTCGL